MVPSDDDTIFEDVTFDVMLATEPRALTVCLAVQVIDPSADLVARFRFIITIQDLPLNDEGLLALAFGHDEVQSLLRPQPHSPGQHAAKIIGAKPVLWTVQSTVTL